MNPSLSFSQSPVPDKLGPKWKNAGKLSGYIFVKFTMLAGSVPK